MMLKNIELKETGVVILDQTQLPNREVYKELQTADEMRFAITELQVRGAPAIGIFAGYALYFLAKGLAKNGAAEDFFPELEKTADFLGSARPTAVNLRWALSRCIASAKKAGSRDMALLALEHESRLIHEEDKAMCRAISRHGLPFVTEGGGILTHCNAGPIATSEYGTGLGSIFLAKEEGINFRVYCDETRPLLQGARLTAFELHRAGIDTTLICDNMASYAMKSGLISAVFAGCDRVAANGDTANKIGTSGAAIIAKHYGIPFYVFCPSSTIDKSISSGKEIVIEQRGGEEIAEKFFKERIAPAGIKFLNPAFDVTDNSLITAIVTEKGVVRPPYAF